MIDFKDYYKTVKKVAKDMYDSAKTSLEKGSNNATIFYDNYFDDFEEKYLFEENIEALLHYEIMSFDDVIQCDINSLGDNDLCIVFK